MSDEGQEAAKGLNFFLQDLKFNCKSLLHSKGAERKTRLCSSVIIIETRGATPFFIINIWKGAYPWARNQ